MLNRFQGTIAAFVFLVGVLFSSPMMALQEDLIERTGDPLPKKETADQEKEPEKKQDAPREYVFSVEKMIPCTPVKDQGRTGTCWSFATASFFESEVIRLGGPEVDLSEMYIARNMYFNKARNYLYRQGKTNFGQGALAHDYLNSAEEFGLVPESVFRGKRAEGGDVHDHSELETVLGGMLKSLVERGKLSANWDEAVQAVLDVYLGSSPSQFVWEEKSFTPQQFRDHLKIRPEDYVNLTSFTHHPFGKPFVLEIPDNFSGGAFMNVPLDDLVGVIDNAIDNGFSVAWDGDVSEAGFMTGQGFAVLPSPNGDPQWRRMPSDEPDVDQESRQQGFDSLQTTDDHLMHLVGRARDQNGRKYYIVKNSWGPNGKLGGFVYMSEGYVRMKTVAITVHRDAMVEKSSAEETTTSSDSGLESGNGLESGK